MSPFQNVRIGSPGNNRLEVSNEKGLTRCPDVDPASLDDTKDSGTSTCDSSSCFCPFASGECVDACGLGLCSPGSTCLPTSQGAAGYQCRCPPVTAGLHVNATRGRYCDPVAKEVKHFVKQFIQFFGFFLTSLKHTSVNHLKTFRNIFERLSWLVPRV